MRVYPKIEVPKSKVTAETPLTPKVVTESQEDYPVAEARNLQEVKALLVKGYKYEMDFEGIKLFLKK
ncbi:MAG: hypothetical protein NWF00_11885 [Candidatus Bathyarchaeota archaeon]|nr:hypothetical protein [Candidatus Bathyarchaeota archaeon]